MSRNAYTMDQQNQFLEEINNHFKTEVLTAAQINKFVADRGYNTPYFLFHDQTRKVARGQYSVAMAGTITPIKPLKPLKPLGKFNEKKVEPDMTTNDVSMPAAIRADISCTIPDRDPTYVPFGNYSDIETIIKTKMFFPVYITGLSGNGKTMSITQACAKLKRELVRINVTEETDELDLIGGTELVNGSTVNREGAVLLAMRRGSLLLIDEGDLNNTKILCLMPILEGKPYFNKKTGEVITPAEGFNIFITGNTKGKGSEDGRFVGTKVMNEAFLERFSITMEQEYPSPSIEKKIVVKNMEQFNCVDEDFADKLVTWSEIIRKSFYEGATDEIISTRRLVHIVKTFSIFSDRKKAITLALNRFDTETKNSFVDLYEKCDTTVNAPAAPQMTDAELQGQIKADRDLSDPSFWPIIDSMTASFNTPVKMITDLSTGSIVVYAYGHSYQIPELTIRNYNGNPFEFYSEIMNKLKNSQF